jgi:hydrogenase maturation protease
MEEVPFAGTLVIGYGNSLRGDDGLGQVAALRVEQWGLPGIRSLAVHQLTPELAAEMASARQVVFVDASANPHQTDLQVEEVAPLDSSGATSHFATPQGLLSLCRNIYESSPRVLLIKAPAPIMALGETLSPAAERSVEQALAIIRSIAAEPEGERPRA